MKVFLSVAHAPQSPGCGYDKWREYDLSRLIAADTARRLEVYGIEAIFANVGADNPDKSYGGEDGVKAEKVRLLDEIEGDVIGIELHFQKADGVAILYHRLDPTAERIAKSILPTLVHSLGGKHWKGLIPCPNSEYYDEKPEYIPFFLDSDSPSIIIEVGSMKRADFFTMAHDIIAMHIADALAIALL